MRLTLRTLLAYLDDTLEPQDATTLKAKLAESGFATQLVQRIRASMVDPAMPAPSPDAAGPNDDANVIGEYLDSTLSTEHVAEIERACLESDVRLAEVAACHQVLTMVLGNKADVPAELRKRIYELPEREIGSIAASSKRFSSLSIDDAPPIDRATPIDGTVLTGGPFSAPPDRHTSPTADMSPTKASSKPSSLVHSGSPVTPVGPADSGVSDAPTRLRESGVIEATLAKPSGPAIAGAKPRDVNDTAIYGGSIRTSRITPWLVTLATAGVLLFALSKLFAPVLNRDVAMNALEIEPSVSVEEIQAPPEMTPPMVDMMPPPNATEEAATEPLPVPETLPTPVASINAKSETESETKPEVIEVPVTERPSEANGQPKSDDVEAVDVAPPMPTQTPSPEPEKEAEPKPEPSPAIQEIAPEVATIVSDRTLVATNKGAMTDSTKWVFLRRGMTILPDFPVVCAPTFRATMTTVSGFEITLVGPVEVVWELRDDAETETVAGTKLDPILHVLSGRILVRSTSPGGSLSVKLGEQMVDLTMADSESVVAASIKHFRAPGQDPLEPGNGVELTGVLCVQGSMKLASGDATESLQTGQQWVKRTAADAKISPVDSVPEWINPPDPAVTSLAAGAREGLIELISGEPSLEIALREATLFRRSEVAALAAESLLYFGQGDIYFGSDGILSEPKQRAYWPEHYLELMSRIDRGPDAAAQLVASIEKMDAANAKSILRLLTGYSPKQLETGGDAELVDMLDSESMAVRVLALEHLHRITGTTLYFRAEQDNAVRRAPGIKKWRSRQRMGDIRWGE